MIPNFENYDYILVAFSGGKDSLACILRLLDLGVPASKIECHHHIIDGRESNYHLFDWPVTTAYCKAVCDELGIPLYYSWHKGGLEAEMLRQNSPTAPTLFEKPDGTIGQRGGERNQLGTRMRYPQTSSDLSVRYCSAYGKIMVLAFSIRGQDRFKSAKTLVISGERREESASRSKYLEFDEHDTNCQSRHVDLWRAVIDYKEEDVWSLIRKYRIIPHPAYYLGFGRCSCALCIFSSNNQLASIHKIAPEMVQRQVDYEEYFAQYWREQEAKNPSPDGKKDYTLHRDHSIMERVQKGTPFEMDSYWIKLALSDEYNAPVIAAPGKWVLPSGAFNGDKAGPS